MNITIHTQAVHLHSSDIAVDVLKALESAMAAPLAPLDVAADKPAPTATTETLVPGVYYSHEGGIYIGSMPARGAVAAHQLFVSRAETETTFGPSDAIDGCADHWDGPGNTKALLDSGKAHPAAQWCKDHAADGKTDWYLPAHAELALAWVCCAGVFSQEGWYWSSTQDGRDVAWAQDFEDGVSYSYYKGYSFRVRAFRRSFI